MQGELRSSGLYGWREWGFGLQLFPLLHLMQLCVKGYRVGDSVDFEDSSHYTFQILP